jgi:ABC-type dipeptide/oligopeptide/nickel transport system permease subunit
MSTGEIALGGIVTRPKPSLIRQALRLMRKYPLGTFGVACIVVIGLTALFAPLLTPYSPVDSSFGVLKQPSQAHPLGTDRAGRDVLSRVIWGGRTSLSIGIIVSVFSAFHATLLGMIAGYYQRWPDYLIQRGSELLGMMPNLLILFMFVFAFGPGFNTLVVAMTLPNAFGASRVIRAAIIREKQSQYVEATMALGAGHWRIMLRHLLPNVLDLAVVQISISIGGVILGEAALSFLGLGIPPPTPSWGADIGGQARTYFRNAPWLALAPGTMLSLTVLGVSLFGDALRDHMDPRLRRRGR